MARSERGASLQRAARSERRRQMPLLPRAPRVAFPLALAGSPRRPRWVEMARISTRHSRLGQPQKEQQRDPLQYFNSLLGGRSMANTGWTDSAAERSNLSGEKRRRDSGYLPARRIRARSLRSARGALKALVAVAPTRDQISGRELGQLILHGLKRETTQPRELTDIQLLSRIREQKPEHLRAQQRKPIRARVSWA